MRSNANPISERVGAPDSSADSFIVAQPGNLSRNGWERTAGPLPSRMYRPRWDRRLDLVCIAEDLSSDLAEA